MYDYVIVAAGSGGRLAAARVSHGPDVTVALPVPGDADSARFGS